MDAPSVLPLSGSGGMASILPDSDTTSASSDVSPSPLLSRHNQARGSDSYSHTHDPTSASSSQHSLSQTPPDADAINVASPVAATVPLSFRSSGPIKRKPVSSSASSLATQYLAHQSTLAAHPPPLEIDLPKPGTRFARSPSLDSPTLYEFPAPLRAATLPLVYPQRSDSKRAPSDDGDAATVTPSRNNSTHSAVVTAETTETDLSDVLSEYDDLISDLTAGHTPDETSIKGQDDGSDNTSDVGSVYADSANNNLSSPMFASKPTPPHLRLEKVDHSIIIEEGPRTLIDDSPQSATFEISPKLNKPLPRSPGQASPLASFFGWGNNSPAVTDFSSVPSPLSPAKPALANDNRGSVSSAFTTSTTKLDATNNSKPNESHSPILSPQPNHPTSSLAVVDEMEEELKAIGFELAASIRREIDMEDLVDRLQEQINNPQAPGKRTSDYFSDSGYSSAKFSDYDQSREEIERIQRKADQEKASLRLELTNKVQDERSRRRELDQKIRELQEKASEVDLVQINNLDASGRIKDLENTCEDLRRKLSEERQSKSNFEDLLSALKAQLQEASDERDNLRDEVVPELKARVEGLESEAAEHASLTYESSRMQHQLQTLKQENRSLRNSMVGGLEELPQRTSIGLSRSNSVAAGAYRGQRSTGFGLSRSNSVKNTTAQTDSREGLLERLKDVEAQRDALHGALKSLLERQEFQNRQNQKKIRILENERQKLLLGSPRKGGFERDVAKLKSEVSVLRSRAEDALEQKWQVEKGLGGLKMDLDRAEEEIDSLRALLKERDILIPPSRSRSSQSSDTTQEAVTSESLQAAYEALQAAHAESLERIKQLEEDSDAEQPQELGASIARVEELSSQVQKQLEVNVELRQRLSAAVQKGDSDRRANSDRIAELQERLRYLEEQVVNAQTSSEERVGRHEEEIARVRDAHNEQLRRLSHRESTKTSQKMLLSSGTMMFGGSSGVIPAKRFDEDAEMRNLRARVTELETALSDAETEMQEVVAKMNMAQVEVLNLQEDREKAVRETRRLEQLVKQEHTKGFGGFFTSRSGNA